MNESYYSCEYELRKTVHRLINDVSSSSIDKKDCIMKE